jgi:hypothetical protein
LLYGKTHPQCCKVKLSRLLLSISKSTLREEYYQSSSSSSSSCIYKRLQLSPWWCCVSNKPYSYKNLKLFINSLFCIYSKLTSSNKIENVLPPLSFKQYPIMLVYVHTMSWWSNCHIIPTWRFFDQSVRSYDIGNINPTHHLQVKSLKTFFLSPKHTILTHICLLWTFHNGQHLCENVKTRHTNCDDDF